MNLTTASELAERLLREHQLDDWSFSFDRARTRAGATHYAKKKITLSRELTAIYLEAQVRDVILHEIAHALVGPGHNHDAVWRAKCVEIGAEPHARLREDANGANPRPAPLWIGTCPVGHKINRYRRPRTPQSCARCSPKFSQMYRISWRNCRSGEVIS